jgi:hypothetical protein
LISENKKITYSAWYAVYPFSGRENSCAEECKKKSAGSSQSATSILYSRTYPDTFSKMPNSGVKKFEMVQRL